MRLYVSLFPDGKILQMETRGSGAGANAGSVVFARFSVGAQTIACMDSEVQHAFTFTPASSLFVDFDSETELVRVLEALSTEGQTLMELASYGFSRKFAWINDRFGVSWQLNLP